MPTFPATAKPLVGMTELTKDVPTPKFPAIDSFAPGAEVPIPTLSVEVVSLTIVPSSTHPPEREELAVQLKPPEPSSVKTVLEDPCEEGKV